MDYRSFLGLDSRVFVWIVAELHLMFAAFVLGVPIFAVIVEVIGARTKDERYDKLAKEFTKLLVAAFSTTAALGGLMSFALFGLYPRFMRYLTDIFHGTMYIYALLFFLEAFSMYLYYYSWDRLKFQKWLHILIGIGLNLVGTAIMFIANSWGTFMMSPTGVEKATGKLENLWQAIANPLWMPVNIHRLIANVAFGGFVVGAYAAVKFLSSKSEEEKAHYDWMGYVGNFIGILALIPLPFAGYWLGREIYSFSPLMGNNMMGGRFSWLFIIQAILIGILFIGVNYYLWIGMSRIKGSERYAHYIKYINAILFVCFAIWLTPHNLPLKGTERALIGEQYHPVLKYLGLMSAKNAAVNFIILSTFTSFLLYRRADKDKPRPFKFQSSATKIVLIFTGFISLFLLYSYANSLIRLSPSTLDISPDKKTLLWMPIGLLGLQMAVIITAVILTFQNKGILGQAIVLGTTCLGAVFILGIYGYIIMDKANPFLRNIAVVQVLMVLSCLIMVTAIDVSVFKKAGQLGSIQWGKMPGRSQYVLILLCVTIVILMGLMGYIRSGLRENWHVYEIMEDTSASAYTPTMAYMSRVVGAIVILFFGLISFVFWLSGLGEKKDQHG